MKKLERKIMQSVLVVCSIAIAFFAFYISKRSQSVIVYAQGALENTASVYDSESTTELIAEIENELSGKGTSVLEVLEEQKSFYMGELSQILSAEEEKIVRAKIDVLEKEITDYSRYSIFLNNDKMRLGNNGEVSIYVPYVSPDCYCGLLEQWVGEPCANCKEYTNVGLEVTAIRVGFEARGWDLAADLLLFNRSNNVLDIDYYPELGLTIAEAPQIKNELAYNNGMSESFKQDKPDRLNGLFESTIEGDTYNSLGKFWYSKTDAGNGKVNISIIDRYDWSYEDGGSVKEFNNTMARAQELGILTPFYTRINLTIAGYVPFDWGYINDDVQIIGVADDIVTANIPAEICDLRVRPRDYTPQPKVNITSIAPNAFANQTQLTSVTIPSSVTSIGKSAFYGCTNLEEVIFSNGLISIGERAFKECVGLNSITLPSTVTHIEENAFGGCTNLTSVSLPNSLTSIGASAFFTSGLTSVTIPQNVSTIGNFAFAWCTDLEEIRFNSQICGDLSEDSFIFLCAGGETNGVTLTIGNGVTYIPAYSFYGSPMLKEVVLPQGLTSVGEYAFYGCGLTNVTLPTSLQEVGSSAFDENTGLSITWNYNGTNGLTAENFAPYLKAVNLVDGTQEIKTNAFKNATNLTNVSLPSTLMSIGEYAFYGCGLTGVTLPTSLQTVGAGAFANNLGISITWNYDGTSSLTTENFLGYLTAVNVVDGAQEIKDNAFRSASRLTSVVLPSTLESIGDNAFYECSSLTGLTIPNGVESIGRIAFYGCRNLTSLHIPASVTELGMGITSNCDYLVTLTVDEANPVYRSEGNCVIRRADNALVAGCMGSVIPSSVLSIEGMAFFGLNRMTNIEIGSSVERIGQGAFAETGLTSIRLPASVECLEYEAFKYCTSLETVYIDGYEVIDLEYVDENGVLVTYTYPNSVFFYCDELQTIYVPDAATSAAYRADEYWSEFADKIFVENTGGPIGGGGSGIGGEEGGDENEGGDEEITEEIGGENMVVLITDASATDSRVVWLSNYYQRDHIHPNCGSYTAAEIGALIGEYEYSHFVFYAKTGLFFNRLINETPFGTYFNNGNLVSAMIVTDDGVYKLYDEAITVKRDTYSMGFKIAKEFIYEDSGNWVSEMGEALGYVPITAPAQYKGDLMFLMGLSDVFGYPVKIVTADVVYDEEVSEETSELQEELTALNERGIYPQKWLFVDVETTECLALFDGFGAEYGNFYFFNRDESVLQTLQTVSTHVYLISDKARIPEDVLTVVIEGVDGETAYTWVFQAWEAWGELEDPDLEAKRETYLQFWTNEGYSLAATDWEKYQSFNLNGSWDWDYYQEVTGNTVYVEQNVTSYPATEE